MDIIADNIVTVTIAVVITSVIGGVIAYFKKKAGCLEQIRDDIIDMRKREWRIEKTLIILAKLQEEVIMKTHPELKTEWEEIVKELLKGTRP